jgi:putative flippase GtrA
MIPVKSPKTAQKQGIGLWTYEQEKNTTPFQYIAQIVVGGVFVLIGIAFGCVRYWLASPMMIVVGIFVAHAGVIFWYRRLRKRKLSN